MFDENKLWRERFGKTTKELGKYLRYIFNGHIVIVMVFLLGGAAFYYQNWVKTLTPDFPAAFIMAAMISLIVTYSPIYTFLLEADRIFLIPLESRLKNYFKRSFLVSFMLQAYFLIIALAVFMPIYAQVLNGNIRSFLLFIIALLGLKIINLFIRWQVQFFVEKNVHNTDSVIRYCLNAGLLFLLFSKANWIYILVIVVLLLGLYFYYRAQTEKKSLKWELLIEQEERRMMSFYRLANMFTDVPKLKDRVKRRRWLDWVMSFLRYQQGQTYSHLYIRTFLRAGDYLGLFIRLTVICIFVLSFIPSGIGQVFFVLLFMYLTGFQLLPLWNHHKYKIWVQLYPVEEGAKEGAFKKLLTSILVLQSMILAVALLFIGELQTVAISLGAGIVFTYFYVFVYIKGRLKRE